MLKNRSKVARSWTRIAGAMVALYAGGCGSSSSKPAVDSGTADVSGDSAAGDASAAVAQKLVILHTNDIHSHFMGQAPEGDYSPATPNDDMTVGGLARMATAIATAKATATAPVLLLDAGDFMMGTLFELAAQTAAPELQFLQAMGYDATTIGNHELDWTPDGLAAILNTATKGGFTVPILSSNVTFSEASAGDDNLQAFVTANVIRSKLVKTVGTLKVGFFGLLGADAVQVTPQAAPLVFEAISTAATRVVKDLRENDKVDLVIALSHSGIDSTGKGEDADLAVAVPDIDVIISGHTHDKLTAPKIVGGHTVIVTAGSYGQYLGNLQLSVVAASTPGDKPTVTVDGYSLQAIDDAVPGSAAVQGQVDTLIAGLDAVLAPSLAYKKVVARTSGDLPLPAYSEAPIGNLVTDAYRTIGAALQPADPPVIAVEGNGQLRASIVKGTTGNIWFADLFRVTPIGIGPNKQPGYPLVTFYLNAADISSGLELGGAPSVVADQYFLQLSGVKVEYDTSKPPFGRVSSLKLATTAGDVALDTTDTTTCYKVIATNYVAGLLGVVKSFTQGALSVVAKDKDCVTPIDPTTRFVDADPTTPAVDELKQWQAILKYVSGLPPDTDGVPIIPAAYLAAQGRITKK